MTNYISIGSRSTVLATNLLSVSGGTVFAGQINFGGGLSTPSSAGMGNFILNGGSLYMGSGGLLVSGTGTFSENILLSGGTVGAATNWSSGIPMILTNDTGNVTFKAADIANNPHNIVLSGLLSGIGGVVKTGNGTLTLNAVNSYAGGTTISSGVLKMGNTNSIPGGAFGGDVTNSGTIDLNAFDANLNGLNGNGVIDTMAGGAPILTIGANGDGGTYSGIIQNSAGTISVIKSGSGTEIFGGLNLYGGDTTITLGILKLGTNNAIPGGLAGGDVSVAGALDLNTFDETVNALNGNGTIDTQAGGTPTLTVGENGNSGSFSGMITNTLGQLSLIKDGLGSETLSGANGYSGSTTVNAGVLTINSGNSGGGAYSVSSNATLDVQVAGVGSSLNMSTLTLTGGSVLTLEPGAFGNPTAPIINVSGAFNPSSLATINLLTTTTKPGQFTLIKYGTLGGGEFPALNFGNGPGSAILSNNIANQSIDVVIVPLIWDANGTALPNPDDGSAFWLGKSWWNGFTNVVGNWSSSAVNPDYASFGAGSNGTYSITVINVGAGKHP